MKSFLILISLLIFLASRLSMALLLDAITQNHPIKDGDLLLSSQKTFALGFFRPGNGTSRFRYVGIWYYKVPVQTVVWVANRDNPINDKSGILTISSQGGLVIYGENRSSPLWSANLSVSPVKGSSASIAKLSDFGNLVLQQNNTVIWQSFDYPTDAYLPFMKLGLNRKSGLDRFITSWKSDDNPGTGNCTYRMNLTGYPQLVAYKGRTPFWRAGSWTGRRWTGVPLMTSVLTGFMSSASYVDNQDETSIMYGVVSNSFFTRLVIQESGTLRRSTWHDERGEWVEFWYAPNDFCDNYGICGGNANCDPSDPSRFECVCLPGFEPRSRGSWDARDASGGCVRKSGARMCGDGEGFVKVAHVKLPDTSNACVKWGLSLRECKEKCLRDCNCTAYTSANETRDGAGCLSWHGNLVDTRTFTNAGQDLYIRVDAVTLAEYAKKSKGLRKVGKLAISLGSIVMLFLVIFVVRWAKRNRKVKGQEKSLFNIYTSPNFPEIFSIKNELNDSRRRSELPFLNLNTVVAATDNFSLRNKVGEGGFGSVYKVLVILADNVSNRVKHLNICTMDDGKQIAVKRLCQHSRQGIEEFKNEIMLIAKLQHRNLVRLLGCCVQRGEKILIYEYLPNKSLDSFIFDEEKRKLLDWRKRFDIICGIARGMLYLHQDSRLKIIHRDLKASNVLLDETMNPKIADFGMARFFGTNEIEANTNRVVGTYGYMSPEYAMEGRFSIKSDVYSFGVLLLEIITGKKNTGHYHENSDRNLVGRVWELWRESKALEILDSSLDETFASEAVRCISIGLLCVQESAVDRPTMSAVVFMLGNDLALPSPKQPAFLFQSGCTSGDLDKGTDSINDVTCSIAEGR